MEVALFVTCLTDTFFPRVGEAVVRVLRHFGCRVEFPAAQTCCGQPAYNSGFHAEAASLARRFIAIFEPCEYVVSPSASCATMVKRHYPLLLDGAQHWKERATRLASKTFEFTAFLREVLKVDIPSHLTLNEPVTFHYPCHARDAYGPHDLAHWLSSAPFVASSLRRFVASPVDSPAPELHGGLRAPQRADLCCGFGGMFALDLPEISAAMMRDKLHDLASTGAQLVICNEGGCSLNLAGGAHRLGLPLRFKHIAECLAESLGLMERRP